MSDEEKFLADLGFEVPAERVKDIPLGGIQHAGCVTSYVVPKEWAERHGFKWAQDALRFVSEPAYRMAILAPKRVAASESMFGVWETDGLTRKEMEALVTQRVLRRGRVDEKTGQQEEFLSRARLFKTPKPVEPPKPQESRLIFDCREANAASTSVESFELPGPGDLVHRMRKLGKARYLVCDLVTWFYEISCDEEFSRTMCVMFEGERYFPEVLSMGHQASPYAAHHLAKIMAVMTTENQDSATLGIDREDLKNNPVIVTLYDSKRNEIGFVTVYIDNIIVAIMEVRGQDAAAQMGGTTESERESAAKGGIQVHESYGPRGGVPGNSVRVERAGRCNPVEMVGGETKGMDQGEPRTDREDEVDAEEDRELGGNLGMEDANRGHDAVQDRAFPGGGEVGGGLRQEELFRREEKQDAPTQVGHSHHGGRQ